MGYHVIDPDDLDPEPDRPSEMRYISEAAGLDNVGLRVYRVEPGEEIPVSGLHYHDQQEEIFHVLTGRLAVETPDRTYPVETGEFFVAEPESPHRAYNPADATDTAEVVGIGAPSVSDGHVYDPDS
jgi:uncharacterized cupin superfamily protein